mmetsp:Transcript_136543/g.345761  ORF Transcript_136543/g.345761 Transcript_136543/m.345761 type:complete len:213 (-) Transcript_136543:866-1504(-)
MLQVPSSRDVIGGNSASVAYSALISKDALLKNVKFLSTFIGEPAGKTVELLNSPSTSIMLVSPSSSLVLLAGGDWPIQPMLTGNGEMSFTWKSRTLYNGDKIAACRAQPRETLSSWFIVVERSLPPNASEHSCFTHGTREPPPTISTESICSGVMPEAAKAASKTAFAFSIAGLHISSKSARVIWLAKSSSSIRHSQLMGASEFAERTFFVF